MTKEEVILLLTKNGYQKHLIFQFYSIPKKTLGNYFYVQPDVVIIGKIKWGNISLHEIKEIKIKSFSPHNYGLTTELDLKRTAEVAKRMVANRQKHAIKKGEGFVDIDNTTEETPQ